MPELKKILVINVNWVGDVIFSTPVFKSLKKRYPDAKVDCLTVSRVKDVLESVDGIDDILFLDDRGFIRRPIEFIKLISQLRKKKYDVAIILHKSYTRAFIPRLAGIPIRVGYATKGRAEQLTHVVENVSEQDVHRSDYYCNVLSALDIPIADKCNSLNVDDDSLSRVDTLLQENGCVQGKYLVVVNPGGNWELKRWSIENYARLIDYLNELTDVKVVISGSPNDVVLASEIITKMKSSKQPIVLAGKTSLKDMMALLARADVMVSADSGPLHIANAVGTDVIGIFGPTRPEITGPRGSGGVNILMKDVGCNQNPCYHLACTSNMCMQAVSAFEVFNVVKQIKNK